MRDCIYQTEPGDIQQSCKGEKGGKVHRNTQILTQLPERW